MAPPLYADLGKSARDLFNKGYNYGTVKLDVKTTTENKIDFNFTGEHNNEIQKSLGTLEAKYKCKNSGIQFVEKWNTDNIIKCELSVEDKLIQGLKVTLDSSYAPASGKKAAVLKSCFKHDRAVLNTDVDLDMAGPVVHTSLVAGHLGWLLGAQTSFDTAKSQLSRTNFAVGYAASDFTLHTNVNDGTEVGASIHQKVNPGLDIGVSLSWSSLNSSTRFALASKYQVDKQATVQAKVNNLSQVGVSYTQLMRPGVKMIVSSLIDCRNINGGGHKLGLGLEVEA